MKKILTILISILLAALLIFCVHSCMKNNKTPEETPQVTNPNSTENQPVFDDPDTEEDESQVTTEDPEIVSEQVFTETGIFNGRIDTTSIELTTGAEIPFTQPYRLSPEIAEKLSSYNLEIGSIISFEYQVIDGQFVITKIIQ